MRLLRRRDFLSARNGPMVDNRRDDLDTEPGTEFVREGRIGETLGGVTGRARVLSPRFDDGDCSERFRGGELTRSPSGDRSGLAGDPSPSVSPPTLVLGDGFELRTSRSRILRLAACSLTVTVLAEEVVD